MLNYAYIFYALLFIKKFLKCHQSCITFLKKIMWPKISSHGEIYLVLYYSNDNAEKKHRYNKNNVNLV